MTVEEYIRLDKGTPDARYEYLDGAARLMSGGSVGHARIARNIANAIEDHFLSGPCTVFPSDVQVLIGTKSNGKESYVYPDATVSYDISDRRRDNKLIRSPRIVIEVLSPGTEVIDRGKKLEAYKACPTIQEIVLISQFAQHLEIHSRNEDEFTWHYTLYGPDATIKLTSVDVVLTLAEIYRGIDFDEPLIEE